MPLLQIKSVSAVHPDPVKDLRGSYKRGDIVDVYEDWYHGHCEGGHAGTHPATPAEQRANPDCRQSGVWSTDAADLLENPIANPPFVLVRVSGATVTQVKAYIQPQTQTDPENPLQQIRVRRRLFRVRVDDLPQGVVDQLRDTGYYATTVAAIRAFIRNKVTNQDEG
jgi:hypothetical protein